jgi:hypothetical protein
MTLSCMNANLRAELQSLNIRAYASIVFVPSETEAIDEESRGGIGDGRSRATCYDAQHSRILSVSAAFCLPVGCSNARLSSPVTHLERALIKFRTENKEKEQ